METRCSNLVCRNRIRDATLEAVAGFFTVLAVNRFDNTNAKRMNKLEISRNVQQTMDPGELVSVVCHRGDVNHGHFVSYHRIEDQWYLNDDSRQCVPSDNPLEKDDIESESVDLLFFKKMFD